MSTHARRIAVLCPHLTPRDKARSIDRSNVQSHAMARFLWQSCNIWQRRPSLRLFVIKIRAQRRASSDAMPDRGPCKATQLLRVRFNSKPSISLFGMATPAREQLSQPVLHRACWLTMCRYHPMPGEQEQYSETALVGSCRRLLPTHSSPTPPRTMNPHQPPPQMSVSAGFPLLVNF
ncbi:hypothetical protein PENSPDRAFT_379575 [Peniophora sp. CONT]|nr:hypothetical protein PENSPDRAFT_379575 [Peniophora sp. CONT]